MDYPDAGFQLLPIHPHPDHLPDDTDPWAYVWSLNSQRRDLGSDQRYLIWKDCTADSEAWQAERQRIQEEANAKRSEAAKGNLNATKAKPENSQATTCGSTETQGRLDDECTPGATSGETLAQDHSDKTRKSSTAAATASNTNRGAVERMDRLHRERPDLSEKVLKHRPTLDRGRLEPKNHIGNMATKQGRANRQHL